MAEDGPASYGAASQDVCYRSVMQMFNSTAILGSSTVIQALSAGVVG